VAEIKQEIKPVSNWLTYELETKKIEPPILKVKLAPINRISSMESVDIGGNVKSMTKILVGQILEAVEDWDLTLKDEKLPVSDKNKRIYLIPLLGEQVKGKDRALLGFELFAYANNLENYLKN